MSEGNRMKVGDVASRRLIGLDTEALKSSNQYRQAIAVTVDKDAVEVAELAEAANASLVVVLDARNEVYGVLDMPWMLQNIEAKRQENYRSLSDALLAISQDPDDIARGFQQDALIDHRPELHRCPAGHYTIDNPCPDHEN